MNENPTAATRVTARVIRAAGLQQLVRTDAGLWLCEVRGRLKAARRVAQSPVVVGDWVEVEPIGAGAGVIERVLPRRSQFARAATGFRPYQQIVAANVDQLIVVAALVQPVLRPGFIDRALVMAERGGLQPLVCLNKADLVATADTDVVAAVYQSLGYPVCVVSAQTGQGMEALQARLTGRDSVLVGQSGVGKSSLLNRLEPGLQVRTQELMRLHQRGRHTTAGVQLYALAGGGNIIDTPGIKELRLWDVSAEELVGYFVEMADLAGQCRFRDCTHVGEPGCAIIAAVDAGMISQVRHEGYARIHQSL